MHVYPARKDSVQLQYHAAMKDSTQLLYDACVSGQEGFCTTIVSCSREGFYIATVYDACVSVQEGFCTTKSFLAGIIVQTEHSCYIDIQIRNTGT